MVNKQYIASIDFCNTCLYCTMVKLTCMCCEHVHNVHEHGLGMIYIIPYPNYSILYHYNYIMIYIIHI
jgi:hypothetical protein